MHFFLLPWYRVGSSRALAIAAGCVLLSKSATVWGAESRDLSDLSLEELLEVQVDTVSAASRRRQLTTDAPSSVTVVNRNQIQQLGYQTLADVLRGVRGLYVSYDRNYSYLGSRGFNRPGDYNSRVLFLVNGQRVNDALTEGMLIGQEFVVDVDMIDRVEVVRGPGSALYGSSAYFAVVNVVTREPAQFNRAEVSFEGGSLDYYKGTLSIGHRWENEIEFVLSGSVMTRAGYDDLFYPELRSGGFDGFSRGLDHEDAQRAFGHFAWKGVSLEFGYVDRFKRVPTAAFDTIPGDPRFETRDKLAYGRLMLEQTLESGTEIMASVAMNRYDYDGGYPWMASRAGLPPAPEVQYECFQSLWIGEELLVRHEFWDRFTLTGGLEARQNLDQDQLVFTVDPYQAQLEEDHNSNVWGLYSEGSFKATDSLTFTAGGRYDHYSGVGDSLNPRVAAIWQATDSTTLKLVYGTAFRVPSSYERHYNDNSVSWKPNLSLRPESIRTYEAIVEQRLGRLWRVSLTGYRFEAEDLIRLDVDPADGLLVFSNADRAIGQGIEAEIEGRGNSGWRTRLSYALQSAEDRANGDRLSNSPRHLLQGQVIIPLWTDRLTAGLEGRYVSHRHSVMNATTDPQIVLNLTLFTYRWIDGLELSATVYNLFDRRYSDPGGPEHRVSLIGQDRRQFRIKLTYAF